MAERSFLGRGYESTPGRPLGWAWHRERDEIRAHLKKRGRWHGPRDEFAVSRIQQRLHRNKPTFAERHAAWRDRQTLAQPMAALDAAELRHLVDLFAGANDPMSLAIAAKAAAMLGLPASDSPANDAQRTQRERSMKVKNAAD